MSGATPRPKSYERGCDEPGCLNAHYARGRCHPHYQRAQYHSDPETARARRRARYPRKTPETGVNLDPTPLLALFHGARDDEVARFLNVHHTTVNKWRNGRRRIRYDTADRLAIELGLHPLNLWPEWGAA